MALLKIFDVKQPCLRAACRKVSRLTASERRLIDDMIDTMRESNGIGLAAPQVGSLLRIIVVEVEEDELFALVNPELVSVSEETDIADEGCLSLPNYFGPVERPSRAVVRATDPNGRRVKIKADGLLARCLQHEIDHLDGILFFDPSRMRSLSDLRYTPPGQADDATDQAAEQTPHGRDTPDIDSDTRHALQAAGMDQSAASPDGNVSPDQGSHLHDDTMTAVF